MDLRGRGERLKCQVVCDGGSTRYQQSAYNKKYAKQVDATASIWVVPQEQMLLSLSD
nr:hypothetical protein [Clostridium minihomine]